MAMGNVTGGGSSGAMSQVEALADLLANPDKMKAMEAEKAEWQAVKDEANEALQALQGEKTGLEAREKELEAGQSVLEEERAQLEEEKSSLNALRADLAALQESLAEQRAALDTRQADLDGREQVVAGRESDATAKEALAADVLHRAEAEAERIGERIEAVNAAWKG